VDDRLGRGEAGHAICLERLRGDSDRCCAMITYAIRKKDEAAQSFSEVSGTPKAGLNENRKNRLSGCRP